MIPDTSHLDDISVKLNPTISTSCWCIWALLNDFSMFHSYFSSFENLKSVALHEMRISRAGDDVVSKMMKMTVVW